MNIRARLVWLVGVVLSGIHASRFYDLTLDVFPSPIPITRGKYDLAYFYNAQTPVTVVWVLVNSDWDVKGHALRCDVVGNGYKKINFTVYENLAVETYRLLGFMSSPIHVPCNFSAWYYPDVLEKYKCSAMESTSQWIAGVNNGNVTYTRVHGPTQFCSYCEDPVPMEPPLVIPGVSPGGTVGLTALFGILGGISLSMFCLCITRYNGKSTSHNTTTCPKCHGLILPGPNDSHNHSIRLAPLHSFLPIGTDVSDKAAGASSSAALSVPSPGGGRGGRGSGRPSAATAPLLAVPGQKKRSASTSSTAGGASLQPAPSSLGSLAPTTVSSLATPLLLNDGPASSFSTQTTTTSQYTNSSIEEASGMSPLRGSPSPALLEFDPLIELGDHGVFSSSSLDVSLTSFLPIESKFQTTVSRMNKGLTGDVLADGDDAVMGAPKLPRELSDELKQTLGPVNQVGRIGRLPGSGDPTRSFDEYGHEFSSSASEDEDDSSNDNFKVTVTTVDPKGGLLQEQVSEDDAMLLEQDKTETLWIPLNVNKSLKRTVLSCFPHALVDSNSGQSSSTVSAQSRPSMTSIMPSSSIGPSAALPLPSTPHHHKVPTLPLPLVPGTQSRNGSFSTPSSTVPTRVPSGSTSSASVPKVPPPGVALASPHSLLSPNTLQSPGSRSRNNSMSTQPHLPLPASPTASSSRHNSISNLASSPFPAPADVHSTYSPPMGPLSENNGLISASSAAFNAVPLSTSASSFTDSQLFHSQSFGVENELESERTFVPLDAVADASMLSTPDFALLLWTLGQQKRQQELSQHQSQSVSASQIQSSSHLYSTTPSPNLHPSQLFSSGNLIVNGSQSEHITEDLQANTLLLQMAMRRQETLLNKQRSISPPNIAPVDNYRQTLHDQQMLLQQLQQQLHSLQHQQQQQQLRLNATDSNLQFMQSISTTSGPQTDQPQLVNSGTMSPVSTAATVLSSSASGASGVQVAGLSVSPVFSAPELAVSTDGHSPLERDIIEAISVQRVQAGTTLAMPATAVTSNGVVVSPLQMQQMQMRMSSVPGMPVGIMPLKPLSPMDEFSIMKNQKKIAPKLFSCEHPGCDDSFTTKFSLRRHMKRHTGERPYSCLVCGKRFAEKSTVQRHMLIHSNGKK